MFDFANFKKIPKLATKATQAMEGFKAFDAAALADGGALTHGTHLVADDA